MVVREQAGAAGMSSNKPMTLEDADALINASRPGAVDEDGTPLWWIGHPNRSWFEVYKRIGELEARVAELERPRTQGDE